MKKCLALVLAAGCMLSAVSCGSNQPVREDKDVTATYLVSQAEYPEMAPYPNEAEYYDEKSGHFNNEEFSKAYDAWRADRKEQRSQPDGYADGLERFFGKSIGEFLSGSHGENKVYSPLNVYMALAMLAETAGGNSRQEVLDLLGVENIEGLRAQASALWNANYCDDGAVTSVLASSLWMNENVDFVQETMDALAEHYYASSYRGEMGSAEFNQALQSWLNEQTGGLLKDQISNIEMDPETILALATTLYFRAKWHNEFSESRTAEGIFYADSGEETCDFMHQSNSRTYYWGERFSAVAQSLEGSGSMWFLLPDEGVSVDELLSDEQAMEFLLSNGEWENSRFLTVNLSAPKFDVTSQMDLIPGLKAMGVHDVFDFAASDFSPMTTDTEEIAVTQVRHGARVTIDEEGCVAAAYTVIMEVGAAAPPEEEVDFVLDRPFVFAITGQDGLPLFVGVVNHPA